MSNKKTRQTNLQKYGVEFPLQNAAISNRKKERWKGKTQDELVEIAQKTKKTFNERYNVNSPAQLSLRKETFDILTDETRFKNFIANKSRRQVLQELDICYRTLYLYTKSYDCNNLYIKDNTSSFEKEVFDFVRTIQPFAEQGNRTILSGKELDIYIPSHSLAIECSGLYWHSESSANRNKNYHYDKFMSCQRNNIRLLTIFEDQWINDRIKIENMIRHALNQNASEFGARQCQIAVISSELANDFIDSHHVEGKSPAMYNYGLMYAGNLVAVMTFSKLKCDKWQLIRYCTIGSIPGAASRLLSAFLKDHNARSIISYSDNCIGPGKLYEKLGFTKQKTKIGYWYTDYRQRFDFDQIADVKKIGYDRIWDCGRVRWMLNT